jgi:hypothetical protein
MNDICSTCENSFVAHDGTYGCMQRPLDENGNEFDLGCKYEPEERENELDDIFSMNEIMERALVVASAILAGCVEKPKLKDPYDFYTYLLDVVAKEMDNEVED